MIIRVFLAALLFVIVTAPIVAAVGEWIARRNCEYKVKVMGEVLELFGKFIMEHEKDKEMKHDD